MKNNIFSWMQLRTPNTQKSQSFYGELFDWSFMSKPVHEKETYIEVDAGEGPCAGISSSETSEPSHWIPFVNVSDIHKYTDKAKSLGAQILVPVAAIGGEDHGSYSVLMDPTGAVIGLYQP